MTLPFELHIHIHERDDRLDERLADVLALLNQLTIQGEETMADLTALQGEIMENTDVTESVRLLVSRLADEIEAASGDQAALDDLVDQLRTNDTTLADLVTANTPVDPGTGTGTPTDTGGATDTGGTTDTGGATTTP